MALWVLSVPAKEMGKDLARVVKKEMVAAYASETANVTTANGILMLWKLLPGLLLI